MGEKWGPVTFCLVVNEFGVKYVGRKHAEHHITHTQKYYPVLVDWTGVLNCGISLGWDYKKIHVNLCM